MTANATRPRQEHEELVLTVGPPAHGGHCVARPADDPSGRVVFVRHALPGETVRAVMTEKSAKIWRADVVEVLSASPDRIEPLWPEAGPGGVGEPLLSESFQTVSVLKKPGRYTHHLLTRLKW